MKMNCEGAKVRRLAFTVVMNHLVAWKLSRLNSISSAFAQGEKVCRYFVRYKAGSTKHQCSSNFATSFFCTHFVSCLLIVQLQLQWCKLSWVIGTKICGSNSTKLVVSIAISSQKFALDIFAVGCDKPNWNLEHSTDCQILYRTPRECFPVSVDMAPSLITFVSLHKPRGVEGGSNDSAFGFALQF